MERKIGRSSFTARASASGPQEYQSTGLCECCRRYAEPAPTRWFHSRRICCGVREEAEAVAAGRKLGVTSGGAAWQPSATTRTVEHVTRPRGTAGSYRVTPPDVLSSRASVSSWFGPASADHPDELPLVLPDEVHRLADLVLREQVDPEVRRQVADREGQVRLDQRLRILSRRGDVARE